jgi:hypothetical protein
MVQQMAPFSAAKTLLNHDLFSFNSRAFPAKDEWALDRIHPGRKSP